MIAAILAVLLSTVSTTASFTTAACDGVKVAYTIPFPYLDYNWVVATYTPGPVTLHYGTDYTINFTSTLTTATLTLNSGAKCPAGKTLRLQRAAPLTQATSFRSQGSYLPSLHENEFDKLTMLLQQLNDGFPIAAPGLASVIANAPILGTGTTTDHLRWDFTAENTWTGKQTYSPTGAGKSAIVANGSAAGGASAVIINGVNSSPALRVNAGANTEAANFVGSTTGGAGDTDATVVSTGGGDATHNGSPAILAQLSATAVTPAGAAIVGLAESAPPCSFGLSQVAGIVGCGGLGVLPNADGVVGVSQSTGRGVVGIGGANKAGGDFTGGGTGPGAKGTGGGTSGKGGDFTGGAPNGMGAHGIGVGLGAGGIFETASSGALGAVGVEGASSGTGAGVYGHSSGTGWGGYFIGGTSDAAGVTGLGGTTNGDGVNGAGSGKGRGVYGAGGSGAWAAEGDDTGVYGLGGGAIGVGVYGKGTAGATGGPGVEGHGTKIGPGVYGKAANNATSIGVFGAGDAATNNIGVSGLAYGTAAGVDGQNNASGAGVHGTSSTGVGGDFGGLPSIRATSPSATPTRGHLNFASGLTTNPSAPASGDVWFNSSDKGYWYYDGASSQRIGGNPLLMATTAAGQSINSGSTTIVVYGTVETDTDSAFNSGTGVFTVPTGKGGHYHVDCTIAWNPGFTATSATLQIYVNGAAKRTNLVVTPATGATQTVSAMVQPTAGQTIDCRATQNQGGAQNLVADALRNFITIKRISD